MLDPTKLFLVLIGIFSLLSEADWQDGGIEADFRDLVLYFGLRYLGGLLSLDFRIRRHSLDLILQLGDDWNFGHNFNWNMTFFTWLRTLFVYCIDIDILAVLIHEFLYRCR